MQKVISNFQGLEGIARSIALPSQHQPHRLPTYPALERTALLAFADTGTYSVTGNGIGAAVLFRDPAFPLWTPQAIPALPFSRYQSIAYNSPLVVNTTDDCIIDVSGDTSAPSTTGNTSEIYKIPVISQGDLWYHCVGGRGPAGTASALQVGIEITTSAALNMTTVEVTYVALLPEGDLVTSTTGAMNLLRTGSNHVAKGTFVTSSAVGFRITSMKIVSANNNTITAVNYGITNANTAAQVLTNPIDAVAPATRFFPTFAPPAFTDSLIPYTGVRANATAVLFSNVTKVMSKEGTVEAARVSNTSFASLDYSNWAISKVHPKDRYFGALENGLYAFSLPDSKSEEMADRLIAGVGTANLKSSCPLFALDKVAYSTVIKFSDLDAVEATNLAVTLDRHLEFRTTSLLFPTSVTAEPLEAYHQAQAVLTKMGTITENNTHLLLLGARAARLAAGAAMRTAKVAGRALVRSQFRHPVAHAVAPFLPVAGTVASKALTVASAGASKLARKARSVPGNMNQKQMVVPSARGIVPMGKRGRKGKR